MLDPIRTIQLDLAIYGWAIIPRDMLAPILAWRRDTIVRNVTQEYVRISLT